MPNVNDYGKRKEERKEKQKNEHEEVWDYFFSPSFAHTFIFSAFTSQTSFFIIYV